jgi:hypothetical protein
MLPSVGIHFKSTDALLSPVLLSNSGGAIYELFLSAEMEVHRQLWSTA